MKVKYICEYVIKVIKGVAIILYEHVQFIIIIISCYIAYSEAVPAHRDVIEEKVLNISDCLCSKNIKAATAQV